ncbi:MAG: hypothetical protein FWE56_01090 [Candidatus Bathyarchaeota archaeon]|nr:hypothetical protein [Candidatus Termiticorpusculum sp.]MCL2868245.1 hypothetical protein [Candidatus Termiticorpusculum sp.]
MDIINLLSNEAIKSLEKRQEITIAIQTQLITIKEIQTLKNILEDKKLVLVLEAMETVTNKNPEMANTDWLKFVQDLITSKSNNIKREASRIVGNIAHMFPDDLETSIQNLMENTTNEGTVIRWGSAYALAKIIQIPQHANSELYDILNKLCEQETENGVKNQLLGGLKKAKKLKKEKLP